MPPTPPKKKNTREFLQKNILLLTYKYTIYIFHSVGAQIEGLITFKQDRILSLFSGFHM